RRLAQMAEELAAGDVPAAARQSFLAMVGEMAPVLAENRMPPPGVVRRLAREHETALGAAGLPAAVAAEAARELAQVGAGAEQVTRVAELARTTGAAERVGRIFTGYLMEYLYLHRNALTIRHAITKIQRIVGALKSYSHLDQNATLSEHDVHEGIEDTLVLMDYALRDIEVSKHFAALPRVPVYADELNQVWTNLIQNAVQAMAGEGRLTLETAERDGGVVVRIIDSGPGIAEDVKSRIFEPFFTTKPKGEGTGLGLGIVRKIIDKHRGTVTCESAPGRTCFEVWLPLGTGRQAERQVS
ncbi:MAG TPA: ATP-binding protein, partial [Kofleriaceae bacterium]|nr:ATP-binding protein [Kofleriaceae bacterium]